MSRTRVVLADDHVMFREAVRTLLAGRLELEVVGEAGTGPRAVELVRELQPHVICLDLSMPGWGLAVTVEKVLAACPGTRVLVLTTHDDPEYVRVAAATGASGYVVKTASAAELVAAVRAVAAGERSFPPTPAGTPDTAGEPVPLSRREREVLELLARGLTHQQAADRLFLSVKSIETYRARLRAKTGLQTRADFVRYGLEAGLLNRHDLPSTDTAD